MLVNSGTFGEGPSYRWVPDFGAPGPISPTEPAPVPTTLPANTASPSPAPPHMVPAFDTIGQTIFRSIGTVRLPVRIIWVQGIDNDHTSFPDGATTLSFAGALCEPIDETEEGGLGQIFDGQTVIYDSALSSPITPPESWTPDQQEQLLASLAQITIYPGDEAQEPDPMILADKGAAITNAFRGIRYIVVPDYPIIDSGLPRISLTFTRTNAGTSTNAASSAPVVEFEAGAT